MSTLNILFQKIIASIKACWWIRLLIGIMTAIGLLWTPFSIWSDTNSLFDNTLDNLVSRVDSQSQTASVASIKVQNSLDKIENRVTEGDCTNFEENWVNTMTALEVNKNIILLRDNERVGSIEFKKNISNLFVLDATFIPSELSGVNTTFSVKDGRNRELSLIIGDGNYEMMKLIYNDKVSATSTILTHILRPGIEPNTSIKLRFQGISSGRSIDVGGTIVYASRNKPTEISKEAVLGGSKSFKDDFLDNKLTLHVGIANPKGYNIGSLKLMECDYKEMPL